MHRLRAIESFAAIRELEAFRPADLLASVIAPFRARAEEKGVALEWAVESAVPDAVMGHLGTIESVLRDLIERALDDTAMGAVVAVARVAGSDVAPAIRFEIADTGRGAPMESNAQRVVDRIGGMFEVSRELHHGSRCMLTVGYVHRQSGTMVAARPPRG